MILRIRRPRIASVCLTTALSLGTSRTFAEEPVTRPTPSRAEVEAWTAVGGSASAGTVTQVAARLEQSEEKDLPELVNDAISISSRRYLTADVHTPWQIMHGLLALRDEYRIKVDGEKVQALNWLRQRRLYKGEPIIEHTQYGGRFHPFTEPYAFEGHPNQFLAILTMSELPVDFTFDTSVGGQVSIQDMLDNAKATVNDREEITWTLWALSRYLPVDSEWYAADGQPWSIERLVQIQTYADPNQAACGGSHGLFALALARNSYLATGRPLRGIWFEADQKIRNYVAQAKSLQNEDGTFSSEYFMGPGYSDEFGKRIATSGHILEFLMVAATDEDLQQEWLRKGVYAVANDLVVNRKKTADCGPLYHALHALVLYRQRADIEPPESTVAVKTSEQAIAPEGDTTDAQTPSGSDSAPNDAGGSSPSENSPTENGSERGDSERSIRTDAKPELAGTQPRESVKRSTGLSQQPQGETGFTVVETLESAEERLQAGSSDDAQRESATTTETQPPSPIGSTSFDGIPAKPVSTEGKAESATSEEAANTDEKALSDRVSADSKSTIDANDSNEASVAESADKRSSDETTYRLPEDNAYRISDAGPGAAEASEIPLPPTED